MKKIILFLAVVFMLAPNGLCTEQNFYLGGEGEHVRILPNTLRTELFAGESEEVFVDIYPEKTEIGVSWELKNKNGVISIFPNEKRCTLLANKEGEEIVVARTHNGEDVEISVRVKPLPEINPRTFELPEKRDNGEGIRAEILRFLLYLLAFGGAGLVVLSVILYVGGKRK